MFQCASDEVTVLFPGKGGPDEIGPAEVRKRYGIPPELVADFIALRGDPSDGIPGGTGIGEKTAKDLLLSYGTLEGAIANAIRERPRVQRALREEAGRLREFKQIATLVQVPVERPADRDTDFAGAAAAARERGMNRLAERLDKLGAA
jgi:DNA polymerase-1